MRLGVFSVLYSQLPFEQALDKIRAMGAEAVEIGCGNYPGNAHCKPEELLADQDQALAFRKAVEERGMVISALSQHGNPVHPDPEFRAPARTEHANRTEQIEVCEPDIRRLSAAH